MIALPILPTLPSAALVTLLHAAVHPSLQTQTHIPTLETVLKAIMALPVPGPSYRHELQRGLSVEDATSILGVMVEFAEMWVEYSYSPKGLEWDVSLDQGAGVGAGAGEGKKQEPRPSLESVSVACHSTIQDIYVKLRQAPIATYPQRAEIFTQKGKSNIDPRKPHTHTNV